ncbi:MAG: beta-lactamase family protein [Actinomycetota bacterium]|nr:beta-lactamase family protein [Actinomycetota bacterium]
MAASDTPPALAADLRRLVKTAQAEKRVPSVSAAVARSGAAIWRDAVGLADVEEERPATPDDQYRIGSITKTFTAAAIMILRGERAVSLDAPLTEYLPDVQHAPTVRRLLSHASGLQREVPGEYWETLALPSREEMLARLGEAEQVLDPASHWHYSNLAFVLLGEIVTAVSDTPYERFIEERLLAPLGLRRTTWTSVEPVARPYFTEPYADGVRREGDWPDSAFRAAGELWSTTDDLCRWGSFLCDPDPAVLSRDTVDEMHRVQIMTDHENWAEGWGLGVSLTRAGDRVLGGHAGGMPGFVTRLAYTRKEKIVAVALANGYADMEELAIALAVKAADELPADPDEWRPGPPPPDEVAHLLGRWWSEGQETIFAWRSGNLEARVVGARPGKEPSVFEELEPDLYRTVSGGERGELLRVVRDEVGVPVKLYWATYPFLRTPEVFGASSGGRRPTAGAD